MGREIRTVVVRHADDARVGDGRVIEQAALELRGSDLEAFDFHYFLDARE